MSPAITALAQLSPTSQQLVVNLIHGLAAKEDINVPDAVGSCLKTPAEGIASWVASLKAEQYSARTIEQYTRIVAKHLKYDPNPSLLTMQQYLADRLSEVSTAYVAFERKALRSFFKFLYTAGLWPTNPTAGLKPIRIRYCERRLPSVEQISTLLKTRLRRRGDAAKFTLMVILLLDTGLRITEACSIKVTNLNLEQLEILVHGKGGKERIVPISPLTAKLIEGWLSNRTPSTWLFPADNAHGYWDKISFGKTMRRICRCNGMLSQHKPCSAYEN